MHGEQGLQERSSAIEVALGCRRWHLEQLSNLRKAQLIGVAQEHHRTQPGGAREWPVGDLVASRDAPRSPLTKNGDLESPPPLLYLRNGRRNKRQREGDRRTLQAALRPDGASMGFDEGLTDG